MKGGKFFCGLSLFVMLFWFAGCAPAQNTAEDYPWPIGAENSMAFRDTVSFTIIENSLTPGGAEFVMKNSSDKSFSYGDEYYIQIEIDGRWYEIDFYNSERNKDTNFAWSLGLNTIDANSERRIENDWRYMYGNLPLGTYRYIKKLEGGPAPFNIACTFTITPEHFPPEDPGEYIEGYPWPLGKESDFIIDSERVSLISPKGYLKPTGTTFKMVNHGDVTITYGNLYWIELESDGKWREIYWQKTKEHKDDFFYGSSENNTFEPQEEIRFSEDWSSRYGALPPGSYRFVKEFTMYIYDERELVEKPKLYAAYPFIIE